MVKSSGGHAGPGVVLLAAGMLALGLSGSAWAQGFKFSNQDNEAQQQEEAKAQSIADRLSTPCRDQLRSKKINLIIGERTSGGGISANQQNYGPQFNAINQRLRGLGLKTTTPAEIKAQIAQAEIDAYFKGDPDAALAAARKFGASFILRGIIESHAQVNRVINVNEVLVSMNFWLTDARGDMISQAEAHGGSYAGADVRTVATQLINEQADDVVATLYSDYCSRAGFGAGRKKQQ
jgi:hypothetical protein